MKAQAVNFFGCLYDCNGVHPDPGKVDAVHALPAPTNVTELQEFLGLVTYLSPFIPGLSTLTAPLQELLKKDTDFSWNCTYDIVFEQVKEAVVSDTTLRYFDPSLPVTIQVDASQVGAALLQNGKPIAFASKALTKTERRYANIEREMLAAVFGAERFHTYVYGWSFMIESDHKLLESISRKNLADTPAWLQHMMLHLQGYDFTIRYPVTAQVKKWSYQTHSLISVPGQAQTFHWILPSIMPASCQTTKKPFNKPLLMTQKCKLSLTSSSQAGLRTSRRSPVPSALTGNTKKPSPLRTV